jgi:hypothetical protein
MHSCSFTAVVGDECGDARGVSLSQLARLMGSIGYAGKLGDFMIKPRSLRVSLGVISPPLIALIFPHYISRLRDYSLCGSHDLLLPT